MTTDLRALICEVSADILGLDPASLGDASGVDVTKGWDSLQHLSILMALEQELDVQTDPDDLATYKTVAGMVELFTRLTTS